MAEVKIGAAVKRGDASVRQVRGYLRAHRARAEHGSLFYPKHRGLDSPRLDLKFLPPDAHMILNEYSFRQAALAVPL